MSLSIVIPVKDTQLTVAKFVVSEGNLLRKYPTIVIDSGGGAELKNYASTYLQINEPLHMARRTGLDLVTTDFLLNLDVDTLIPEPYPRQALRLLKTVKDVVAVALDYRYPNCVGHLGFGTSIVRTGLLKLTYDWVEGKAPTCECLYMWAKLRRYGYLESIGPPATHIGPHRRDTSLRRIMNG